MKIHKYDYLYTDGTIMACCGMYILTNSNIEYTKKWSEVTCKNCLKRNKEINPCDGCDNHHAGANECSLDVGNHCIRRAEDYYTKGKSDG